MSDGSSKVWPCDFRFSQALILIISFISFGSVSSVDAPFVQRAKKLAW
jgi:hypothetical protein